MNGADPSPMRRALGRTGFRRLFAAQTISRCGDTFNMVAVVILVYRLTGSGLKVAGTVAFEIAPVLLFGFLAGSVVDRCSRRRVMMTADLARAVVATLLAVFHDQLAVVYLAAFGLSTFTVFFNPAAASALPVLVDDDEVVGANSAVWSAAVISQIALVAVAGPSPAFAINTATLLASAGFVSRLSLPARQPAPPAPPTRHLFDVAEGLRAIRTSRFLAVLAAVQGLAALSAGATSAPLVVLAAEHLHAGAGRFGLLVAAIGVGAGFGPLVLQHVVKDARRPRYLFGPYLLRGAVDVAVAASQRFLVAMGALAVYGVGTSTGTVTYNSVLQTTVPDRLRGRVFAFYDVVWQAGRLLSIGLGGVIADGFGITAVYWTGGVLLLGAGCLGLAAGRTVVPVVS